MWKYKTAPIHESIENDEQWIRVMEKPQLIVVDVYSDWCGPCVPMISFIKRFIQELGRDYLYFVMAKSDTISFLKRFRNKSEPTWLLLSHGVLVNIMYGSNGSMLKKMITDEIKREQEIAEGKRHRLSIDIESLPKRESKIFDLPPEAAPKPEKEPEQVIEEVEAEINYYPFQY